MPQVALLSSTDPLQECLKTVFELIETRLMSADGIDGLEELLGMMFCKVESLRGESSGLMFEM
jgi:hypothetical protein